MKALIGVIAPTTTRLLLDFGGFNAGATIPVEIGTTNKTFIEWNTSSMVFVELASVSYTADKDRAVSVLNLYLFTMYNNSLNGRCKLQISGDGGTTWVDMTNTILDGFFEGREGPGLWITTINPGDNQLKIRLMGLSTDGANATIRFRQDSFLDVTLNYQ